MEWRVGARVTVEVGGRVRPGHVTHEEATFFDVECDDGDEPSGYRIPKEPTHA